MAREGATCARMSWTGRQGGKLWVGEQFVVARKSKALCCVGPAASAGSWVASER